MALILKKTKKMTDLKLLKQVYILKEAINSAKEKFVKLGVNPTQFDGMELELSKLEYFVRNERRIEWNKTVKGLMDETNDCNITYVGLWNNKSNLSQ